MWDRLFATDNSEAMSSSSPAADTHTDRSSSRFSICRAPGLPDQVVLHDLCIRTDTLTARYELCALFTGARAVDMPGTSEAVRPFSWRPIIPGVVLRAFKLNFFEIQFEVLTSSLEV